MVNDEMKRYEAIITRFYSLVSGKQVDRLEDIPADARQALCYLKYNALATPFICDDLERGLKPSEVAIKYHMSRGSIRNIGRRYGILPRGKQAK